MLRVLGEAVQRLRTCQPDQVQLGAVGQPPHWRPAATAASQPLPPRDDASAQKAYVCWIARTQYEFNKFLLQAQTHVITRAVICYCIHCHAVVCDACREWSLGLQLCCRCSTSNWQRVGTFTPARSVGSLRYALFKLLSACVLCLRLKGLGTCLARLRTAACI